jgi:hypothetical protein
LGLQGNKDATEGFQKDIDSMMPINDMELGDFLAEKSAPNSEKVVVIHTHKLIVADKARGYHFVRRESFQFTVRSAFGGRGAWHWVAAHCY